MQIKDVLNNIRSLQGRNSDLLLAAEVLLMHMLAISKEEIFSEPERLLSESELKRFLELFERYKKGEPLAYLTGKKDFYGLEFVVGPNVLIPRPETEMLVERVLEYAREFNGPILDIGTGSGCIAVALAKRLGRRIYASDISEKALKVAEENARIHSADVEFFQSDLLEEVERAFDIIAANLPYIGKKKFNEIDKNVAKYEPHKALYSGDDGLIYYRRLFDQISKKDWKPKVLIGEIGAGQGPLIKRELNKFFAQEDFWIEKDLASFDRMFVVRFLG
jgi:release factor glutamine methyltransferase